MKRLTEYNDEMPAKKYSWNFEETESWGNEIYDTVEECIIAACNAVMERDYMTYEPPTTVYVGEIEKFVPYVCPERVLEDIEEQASDFAGEAGCDWDAYDPKKQKELNELEKTLSLIVNEWLKKYGYTPSLYTIHNIKEHTL